MCKRRNVASRDQHLWPTVQRFPVIVRISRSCFEPFLSLTSNEEDVEEDVAAKGNGLKPTEGLASVGAKRGREESAEAPNGGAEQDAKKVKM